MGNLSNPNAFSGIVKGLGEGGGSVDFPTDITNPQDGQLLQYDATSEKWINTGIIRFINEIYEVNHICTQDDIDKYGIDDDNDALILGNNYSVFGLEITYNDLLDSNILNIVVTGNADTQYGNYYFAYGLQDDGESHYFVEDHSSHNGYNLLNKDVYLKSFTKNFS